jgi:hypothetical protein
MPRDTGHLKTREYVAGANSSPRFAADNPGVGIQEIPNAGAWASGQLTDLAVYFISGCRGETAGANS